MRAIYNKSDGNIIDWVDGSASGLSNGMALSEHYDVDVNSKPVNTSGIAGFDSTEAQAALIRSDTDGSMARVAEDNSDLIQKIIVSVRGIGGVIDGDVSASVIAKIASRKANRNRLQ